MNKVLQNSNRTTKPSAIYRCWSWWVGEIRSLVSQDLLRKYFSNRKKIVATLSNSEIHIIEHINARNVKTVMVFECSLSGWEAAAAYLNSNRGSKLLPKRFGLRLAVTTCHKRVFRIPKNTMIDLPKIVELELERKTPFILEDIYTDYIVTPDEQDESKVIVHQYLIKRSMLEETIQFLKSKELDLEFIDVFETEPQLSLPINFLKIQKSDPSITNTSKLNKFLFLGILLFSISATHLLFKKEHRALKKLNIKIDSSRKISRTIRNKIDSIHRNTNKITNLHGLKTGSASLIQVWGEVTGLLPDTAWLNELNVNEKKIHIIGYASSAAPLIRIFENSHLFSSVSFGSPVIFDNRIEKERFNIVFQLESAANKKMSDSTKYLISK